MRGIDCSRTVRGRPTILARMTVLQALGGLSDREACEGLEVDLRAQTAAGVHLGYEAFRPAALVDQRSQP